MTRRGGRSWSPSPWSWSWWLAASPSRYGALSADVDAATLAYVQRKAEELHERARRLVPVAVDAPPPADEHYRPAPWLTRALAEAAAGPQDMTDREWRQRDCEHDRWFEYIRLDQAGARRTCEDCGRDLGRAS